MCGVCEEIVFVEVGIIFINIDIIVEDMFWICWGEIELMFVVDIILVIEMLVWIVFIFGFDMFVVFIFMVSL